MDRVIINKITNSIQVHYCQKIIKILKLERIVKKFITGGFKCINNSLNSKNNKDLQHEVNYES